MLGLVLSLTPVPVAEQNRSQRYVCIQKGGARAEHKLTPQCASRASHYVSCSPASVGFTYTFPVLRLSDAIWLVLGIPSSKARA